MKTSIRRKGAIRFLSLVIVLCMTLSLLPAVALAANTWTTVTPGNSWHAIRFAGDYYDVHTYPYSFVHVSGQSGSSNEDGSDNTPDQIRIVAEDLTMTSVPENGQTYEVRLFALPRSGGTWNVITPSEETYSCDIEITNERNYLLKVVLYDFGTPDPSSTIKDFKKIRNLTVSGNVQVELRNSSVGGVQIKKYGSVTTQDGALLIENTVVPCDKPAETAYYFCDASVTVIPGHTTAGYNFDNPNMLDSCAVTVGRRAALTLDNSANKTLNGVVKSITVSHSGEETSAVTLRNITLPESSELSFLAPCTVSLIGATTKGQLIFDGQGESRSVPFTLALNGATLRESVTVRNYGELTMTLAGKNELNTYQEIYNPYRNNRPDIMVANDSRLTIQDDPASADVGSLEIGDPAIDPYSGKVLYYNDAGHYYCAAIGGTPSADPLPHGTVVIKSGVLTAQAQYGGAAIGGSIEEPGINYVTDAESGYYLMYRGDPSALVAGNGGTVLGDVYYLPGDEQFDPNYGGYWLQQDSEGDYYAVEVKPGFTRDGGTVRIEGGDRRRRMAVQAGRLQSVRDGEQCARDHRRRRRHDLHSGRLCRQLQDGEQLLHHQRGAERLIFRIDERPLRPPGRICRLWLYRDAGLCDRTVRRWQDEIQRLDLHQREKRRQPRGHAAAERVEQLYGQYGRHRRRGGRQMGLLHVPEQRQHSGHGSQRILHPDLHLQRGHHPDRARVHPGRRGERGR
ncbi:MAG: hypothetical protein K5981_01520 [Clostridia bacterium]|nr:hypothetical protein [Clostridia bacterium]